MQSLPVFLVLRGRAVILTGSGEAADAKRRLLERAGARVVGEAEDAAIAIVADGDDATAARLKARGVLVNATDRPELCDFTLPAIIDREPVLIAIGTGGASAGLAKALRQRIEAILPEKLGRLATALHAARDAIRARWPDASARRRAIDAGLSAGGLIDPLREDAADEVPRWLAEQGDAEPSRLVALCLLSSDPDDLTLRRRACLARLIAFIIGPMCQQRSSTVPAPTLCAFPPPRRRKHRGRGSRSGWRCRNEPGVRL